MREHYRCRNLYRVPNPHIQRGLRRRLICNNLSQRPPLPLTFVGDTWKLINQNRSLNIGLMDGPFAAENVHGGRVNFGDNEGEFLDVREEVSSLLRRSRFDVAVLDKEGA